MRQHTSVALAMIMLLALTSCVSNKKYTDLVTEREKLQLTYDETKLRLDECLASSARSQDEIRSKEREIGSKNGEIAAKNAQIQQLENQVANLQGTNSNLLNQLERMSIISEKESASIQQSLQSIQNQTEYIRELNTKIQSKDSVNLALVMNLKRSLSNINDEDIEVNVRGSVVYVSISDKLLFQSGSSTINTRAKEVLGKVAKVVNDHEDLNVMVEGHTDSQAINTSCVSDNWDLSALRATAVVRVLQDMHGVAPERLTAAGRSYYLPKESNDTDMGRSANRRTEIVITPKLDQFFKLLEAPEVKN